MTIPARLEAIAWDVDGTLIDSEPVHLRALLASCAGHDVDISDLDDDAFLGVSLDGVWEVIGDRFPANVDRERFVAEIDQRFCCLCRSIPPDTTPRAILDRLAHAGWRQVAVSNSGRAVVDANLAHLGIGPLLEFSLSLDDVEAGKPDPAPYRQAAERLGVTASRIVVIEDSASGLASARAAGCVTVALHGAGQPPAASDALVSCLEEIPALLAGAAAWRRQQPTDDQAQRKELP